MARTHTGREQTFAFSDPTAASVQLVGDFTQWKERPISMRRDRDGIWRAKVELDRGTHHYRFLVDGEWRGENWLGRLWMELRNQLRSRGETPVVEPLRGRQVTPSQSPRSPSVLPESNRHGIRAS